MLLKSSKRLIGIRALVGFYRTLSSEVKSEEISFEVSKPRKERNSRRLLKETKVLKPLEDYFKHDPTLKFVLSDFPNELLRKRIKAPAGKFYLVTFERLTCKCLLL